MQRSATAMATAVAVGLLSAGPSAAGNRVTVDPGPRFTVKAATYNVCKVNCHPKHPWAKRRTKVVRTISAAAPDILAVQEAPTLPWRGTTQWADLTGLLARAGYRQTSDKDGCTEGCTRGAHLYYNPARIQAFPMMVPSGQPEPPQPCMVYLNNPDLPDDKSGPAFRDWRTYGCRNHLDYTRTVDRSVGMTSQRQLSGVQWGAVQDRNISWAYLQEIATGGVLLAVSLHMPNEKTARAEAVRKAVASRLPGFVDSLNAERGLTNIPVLVMGDFNSYAARQPRGSQWIMTQSGFTDAFEAPVRIREKYATVNYTPLLRKWDGFPPAPHVYADLGTRIDYIFTRNIEPLSHEVFLQLKGRKFDPAFQGSDHNLLAATLSIPVVSAVSQ